MKRFVRLTALVLALAMCLSGCFVDTTSKTGIDLSPPQFGLARNGDKPATQTKPGAQNQAKPKPVPEPESGTILSGYAPADASEITVILEPTGSAVVMLKDISDRVLLSFYVRGGDTVTVGVPEEMMFVHFAGGTTWYGEDLLFGEDTFYQQDETLTDFTQYSWTYDIDPMKKNDFSYDEPEEKDLPEEAPAIVPPATTAPKDGYIADLGGSWESVYIKDGNFNLNVSALAFSQTVYNVTSMTVNMNVSMNAGTSCKDWNIWGRSGNTFVKIGKIYLAAGDGYVSQTVTFSSPVTFNAIAITPTIVGGYSWSMGISVTDVWYNP